MRLPLFPLRTVLFPGMLLPLHIFEPRYLEMINLCLHDRLPFGVAFIRSGQEVGGEAEPHPIGTQAKITRAERYPDGRLRLETVGQDRFRILELNHDLPYLTGTVEAFPLLGGDEPLARRLAQALKPWVSRYLDLLGDAAGSPIDARALPADPAAVAYLAAIVAQIPLAEKQQLLAVPTAAELLERERRLYRREVSLIRAMTNIQAANDDSAFSPN